MSSQDPTRKIDGELVRYLCKLSRLTLSAAEEVAYSAQVEEILREMARGCALHQRAVLQTAQHLRRFSHE